MSKRRLAILIPLIVVSTGCDQATKQIASSTLKFTPTQSFLGDTFRLQYSENPGAFLSLGAGLPDEARIAVFLVGVGALLGGMLIFTVTSRRLTTPMVASLALFLGGGLSNWADRVAHGNVVVDFMNVGVGGLRTGIFNVADMFVMAGAALFALSVFLPNRPSPAPQTAEEDRPTEFAPASSDEPEEAAPESAEGELEGDLPPD